MTYVKTKIINLHDVMFDFCSIYCFFYKYFVFIYVLKCLKSVNCLLWVYSGILYVLWLVYKLIKLYFTLRKVFVTPCTSRSKIRSTILCLQSILDNLLDLIRIQYSLIFVQKYVLWFFFNTQYLDKLLNVFPNHVVLRHLDAFKTDYFMIL